MAIDSYNFNGLYTITLDSIVCIGGQQTWTYTVTKIGGQDISNWALQLCADANVVSFSPEGAIIEDPNQGQGAGNCLNVNNEIGCVYNPNGIPVVDKQIKWNTTGGTFSFTLDKCYESEKVHVAIKAGLACFCGEIIGPSCIELPPSRGVFCTDAMD